MKNQKIYRATLNTPWARRGRVVKMDSTDPEIIKMVAAGHFVPVKADGSIDVATVEHSTRVAEEITPVDKIAQMRQAAEAARKAQKETEESAIQTSTEIAPEATEGVSGDSEGKPEEAATEKPAEKPKNKPVAKRTPRPREDD